MEFCLNTSAFFQGSACSGNQFCNTSEFPRFYVLSKGGAREALLLYYQNNTEKQTCHDFHGVVVKVGKSDNCWNVGQLVPCNVVPVTLALTFC